MSREGMKKELEAAYKSLERAESVSKGLRKELRELDMVIKMLDTAGYIKEGKLEQALDFVSDFYS